MPKLTLDVDAIRVDSFPVDEDGGLVTDIPRTHEPGCTMCDVCPQPTC